MAMIPASKFGERYERDLRRIKEMGDKSQSERFKQAARELECDDDPERFAERVRKIAKTPPAPKGKPVKTRKKDAEE